MAIAIVDQGHAQGGGSGSSSSASITLSSGLTMLVVIIGQSAAQAPSNCVWNGVTLTEAVNKTCSQAGLGIWYLGNPDSGTHTLGWGHNFNQQADVKYITFSGSATTIGATNSDNNYNAPSCVVTTTGTGNGYCIDAVVTQAQRSDIPTVGAGQTQIDAAFPDQMIAGSYEAFASGADVTMSWTGATGGTAAHAAMELDEFVASGPANMKTWDGTAKASIKSMNGLAIGSVKSWDGLQ